MSYKVENNTIFLTRGDSFTAHLVIKIQTPQGETYTPAEGDELKFALKRAQMNSNKTEYYDKEPLLVKEISIDTMILQINPEDTKSLGFGNYKYDIELKTATGAVNTVINNGDFQLVPEVY